MTAPFAAMEQRLTQAVFRHVTNASATAFNLHGVEQAFDVVFDTPTIGQFAGLVGDAVPVALCKTADVADLTWDSGITIAGTPYTVSAASPDGTGVTRLELREA